MSIVELLEICNVEVDVKTLQSELDMLGSDSVTHSTLQYLLDIVSHKCITNDLQKFVDGKLAVWVRNESEYVSLMYSLLERGIRVDNNNEFSTSPKDYNKAYQYLFIDKNVNALALSKGDNRDWLKKWHQIDEIKTYRELDFVCDFQKSGKDTDKIVAF